MFLLPHRTSKPRNKGVTMIMDKGLSIREAEDLISVGNQVIDIVKLGFGTSLITPNVVNKVSLYQQAGIKVYVGGTLFEAFLIRSQIEDYLKWIEKLKLDTIEISDGSMFIEHDKKCSFIKDFSKNFTVISEVGSKDATITFSHEQWISMMNKELEAGSTYVIAEARESGNVGIYQSNGNSDNELINDIISNISIEKIIWEAPQKSQQAWFIKQYGSNVNLGNIAPNEIIALEALRLGLRGDTFFDFLPEDLKKLKP